MGRGGAGVQGGMSSLDWVGVGPGVQEQIILDCDDGM